MIDEPHLVRRDFGLAHAIGNAIDEIAIGRRALGIEHFADGFVIREGHEIREGSADIDGNDA